MSNSYLIEDNISGNELTNELKIRRKNHYEKSISNEKIEEHEVIGWEVLRRNKNTSRVKLDKPSHIKLVDELWSLYAQLGFTELNKDKYFSISESGNDSSLTQFDIFAKDDETVIISDCITPDGLKTTRSPTSIIEKIKNSKSITIKAIKEHYGHSYKPKFGWVIASRNIPWTETDIQAAKKANIIVVKDQELDYYSQLQKHLKTSARYQFLANIFATSSIRGLRLKVPATKGKMGGTVFYTFLITPEQLLKIAYIGHKDSKGQDSLETYQRMLQPKRLKDISEYINNGGKFPTNIVVNLQHKKGLNFSKKDEIGELSFGELTLPNCYATAWIIDGQHRLYGFAFSERSKSSVVPVLAFVNLSSTAQKDLFVDINNKQTKVPRGLLLDLYSELHWGSSDPTEALTSLCSKVSKVLSTEVNSPLRGRVAIGEQKKSNFMCITITTLTTALIKEQLIGTPNIQENCLKSGALGDADLNQALSRSTKFLSLYLSSFKETLPEQWELGDAKGGYICTNNAIAALFKVLKSIFDVAGRIDKIDIRNESPENLMIHVAKYSNHLVQWLHNQSEDKFVSLRSKVGSKGQIAVSWEMQQEIYNCDKTFEPKGLIAWMDSFDNAGTKEAKILIDEIQLSMLKLTLAELEKAHGEKWWYDGIPSNIRTKCVTRKEEEKGKLEAHQYLDLIDYKAIADSNWSKTYQAYFSIKGQKGNKNKQLSWIVKLNEIRKTVSHPERGLLPREEVDFVKNLHMNLKGNFGEHWEK